MSGSARARVALALGGLALLGCDPPEPSDAGEYALTVTLADRLGRDSERVLVGSQFDLQLVAAAGLEVEDDAPDIRLECVDVAATGALTLLAEAPTGGRFEVSSAGPGTVELADPNLACPEDPTLAALGPDRWSVIGVEPEGLAAAWVLGDEGSALDWGMSPGRVGAFPPGFAEPTAGLRVVADAEFSLAPVVLDPSAGPLAEVRVDPSQASLTVPARWADLVTEGGEPETLGDLAGRLSPGERFTATLTILGAELPLSVEAVPASEVVSLELVPVYWPAEAGQNQREWGPPAGVTAIGRDAEGRRVYGLPLDWSVSRGRLRVEDSGSADALGIGDCKASPRRPAWRGATVEAALGDLVATAELDWVALPSDDTDPDDPLCTGSACDCSTTAPPAGSALASLALLALGAWLRRRPGRV